MRLRRQRQLGPAWRRAKARALPDCKNNDCIMDCYGVTPVRHVRRYATGLLPSRGRILALWWLRLTISLIVWTLSG